MKRKSIQENPYSIDEEVARIKKAIYMLKERMY